jgi:hypothetical protein
MTICRKHEKNEKVTGSKFFLKLPQIRHPERAPLGAESKDVKGVLSTHTVRTLSITVRARRIGFSGVGGRKAPNHVD